MHTLVSKDESLRSSMVYVGYLILKQLDKSENGYLPLAEIAKNLAKHEIKQSRAMIFALIFLHSAGAIEFTAPYVYRVGL